jgi:solute carrier family 25 aspartate/glutamate transporter 12/13
MADIASIKEVVKETLVGSDLHGETQLSAQSKANFDKNAQKDPASGELLMGEEEFISAIAPKEEDYVSQDASPCHIAAVNPFD